MDDSIITILVLAALGIVQLVASINKKKKAQEQRMHSQTGAYSANTDFEETEEPDPERFFFGGLPELQEESLPISPKPSPFFSSKTSPFSRVLKPEEEGGPMTYTYEDEVAKTAAIEENAIGEEDSPLYHFTPQQAILYSEIINPKWGD